MNKNKGFAPILIILIIAGILAAGGGGVWYYEKSKGVDVIKQIEEKISFPNIFVPKTTTTSKLQIQTKEGQIMTTTAQTTTTQLANKQDLIFGREGLSFSNNCFRSRNPNLKPRWTSAKPVFFEENNKIYLKGIYPTEISSEHYILGAVIIKFTQGTGIRLRNNTFISLNEGCDLNQFNNLLKSIKPKILSISREFTRPEEDLEQEKIEGEKNSGQELGDLNLYYIMTIKIDASTTKEIVSFLNFLNSLEIVERVEFGPIASPANGAILP